MPQAVMNKIPNRDVFGYCVNCGEKMIEMRIIDGIEQVVFTPNYTTVMYKLNDGSQMRVAMCKKCVEDIDGTEYDYVMGKVWRGWQHEVETYSHWDEDKKKNYLSEYKKKAIVIRSDDKPADVVERKFLEFKVREMKEKDLKEKNK